MNKEDIERLERQGCFSDDWSQVTIKDGTDLSRIRNVYFRGTVSIGDNTEIINVPGGISNVRIGDNVRIVNVARIENSPSASFGVGTEVAVLDETGGRPVKIYPGISAQVAAMATRMPEYAKESLFPIIDDHIKNLPDMIEIGDGAEIVDCGPIIDVRIWPGVKIEGASWLCNGSIVSNEARGQRPEASIDEEARSQRPEARKCALVYVGQGVNAENFIIEDASVANGVILRNTYVGQGSVLDKGFTSHDSLFFANCSMENGEACAVFAGPFTVSMHKSSLLIGCQTAFMNAGSGTNMSNHMYKMGPLHWGILERGVKTSSNSYMMHGSRIGAFSLVMGEHKTHPDTSEFPFSYLFGDAKGNTTVVPGMMLKSYGLRRDQEKWPKRDRREGHNINLHDRITFNTFNPYTIGLVVKAIDTIESILGKPTESNSIIHNGLILNRSSLKKALSFYQLCVYEYLRLRLGDNINPADASDRSVSKRWVDLGGQIVSESSLQSAVKADSISEIERIYDKAHEDYRQDELAWIASNLKEWSNINQIYRKKSEEFDKLVKSDQQKSITDIANEQEMLSL